MSFGSLDTNPTKKVDLLEDNNELPTVCNNNNDVILNSTPIDGGNSGNSWSFIVHVLKTTILCMVFMFVGPALILLNKHIMQQLSFPYPMFLSGLGVLTSYLFARALIGLGFATVEKKHEVDGMRFYTRVLPVGIAHAGNYY